jgi:hypothetical protein
MSMQRRAVFVIGVGVFAAAMPASRLSAQRADPCLKDPLCQFVAQNIGIKSATNLLWLRKFARLDGETASPVQNVHLTAQVDSVHELRFPGLMIQAYVPRDGAPLLQQILVTSSRYRLPLGLKVATATLGDVQRALGAPKEVERLANGSSRWRYENVEGTATVVFEFAPQSMKLQWVEWLFEVD